MPVKCPSVRSGNITAETIAQNKVFGKLGKERFKSSWSG
jgi:hypothetical protein